MTDLPLRENSGSPTAELRPSGDFFFLFLQCQGMSCAAFVLRVTMGSYVTLVYSHCLRRPRAHQRIAIGTRYPKTCFANSNSDRIKKINGMMKNNI